MQLSEAIYRTVESEIRSRPLQGDELRPVDGFNGLYFSDVDAEAVPQYLYVFTLEVGRSPYLFYRRLAEEE